MQTVVEILTNASFVIIEDFITRVAGTEVAVNSVGTILVASTGVLCTFINIFIYMNNERSISGIVCIKHANTRRNRNSYQWDWYCSSCIH